MTIIHGNAFISGGFRPAVAKVSAKWTHAVVRDGSFMVVKKVLTSLGTEFRPIPGYTQKQLARAFLRTTTDCLGSPITVTKGARAILKEALA